MNILSLSREEVQHFIATGMFRPESLKHYDICRALQSGKTQNAVAQEFDLSDSRTVRFIKEKKCPECGKSRPIH